MAEVYCAEVARAADASLAGTATRAAAFLLVEHRGPWGERAVEENDLPAAVQGWLEDELAALAETVGKSRALLVRREGREDGALSCFLALTQESRRELFRFEVARHEELAGLALAEGLAADRLGGYRTDEPLTLVCGNGRRDRCCARFGLPTYRELAATEGERSWLSTHQGGHRHAGTGLWLPEGVAYGYLQAEEVPALRAARSRGALHLPCFRGRTFHSAVVQAADVLLRRTTGVDDLDPWHLEGSAEEVREGEWRVRFRGARGAYSVRLRRWSEEALVSCTPPKRKAIDRFTLTSWDSEESL